MNQEFYLSASCRCGQLKASIHTNPVAQLVCHCADCRRVSGQAFTEIAFYPPGATFIEGSSVEESMLGGTGKSKSYFSCSNCGDCLYATVDALRGLVGIVAGSISPPFEFKPICHVWSSEKLPDIVLPQNLPIFPKGPPVPPHRL